MDITIHQTFLPHEEAEASLAFYRDALGFEVRGEVGSGAMRTIKVGPADQPDMSILLEPAAVDPSMTAEEHRTIVEMIRKGGYGRIVLATEDLDGVFERLEASDAEVIQEPIQHPLGVRDCAFLDPAGDVVCIQQVCGPAVTVEARDRTTRKADTLAMLTTPAIDVWVATASAAAAPHLVPLSLAWIDERVVIAVQSSSVTARNLAAQATARLALGPTRNVVMTDTVLDRTVAVTADDALGTAYAAQAGWDPRHSPGYVFFVLRPIRVQAWREANEMPGRELMREGHWLL